MNKSRVGAVLWVVIVTVVTDVAAIAANAAAGSNHYPGPLDLVRRYPWQVVGVISVLGLLVAAVKRWRETGANVGPAQTGPSAAAVKRDIVFGTVAVVVVCALVFALDHGDGNNGHGGGSASNTPRATAGTSGASAAPGTGPGATSAPAPNATSSTPGSGQHVVFNPPPTKAAPRTSNPVPPASSPPGQPAPIVRQPPAGYAAGDEVGLEPMLYQQYCVSWQNNVDATEYWLGTNTTPSGQNCTDPMIPDGNWQYSTSTGQLSTDDSIGWCLSVGSDTSEGIGLVVVPCDSSKTAQKWSFVDEGGNYLIQSDEGTCLSGIEENSAISASMQICGSTDSNELFLVNSY